MWLQQLGKSQGNEVNHGSQYVSRDFGQTPWKCTCAWWHHGNTQPPISALAGLLTSVRLHLCKSVIALIFFYCSRGLFPANLNKALQTVSVV